VTSLVVIGNAGIAGPRYRVETDRVAAGVTLKRILDRRGPNRIRVLTVDPSTRVTLDVALATEELPGHEQTTSMARRHGALAAINGDFTLVPGTPGSGRPVNTFIEDGSLKASPLIWGRNFSISRDERRARVGHTRLRMGLTQATGEVWEIAAVNPVTPNREALTMYTPAGGGSFRPPRDSCAARLMAAGKKHWNEETDGLTRDFVVDRVVCRYRRLNRGKGYVVAAGRSTVSAVTLRDGLIEGEVVTFGWSFNRPGMLDTIGGNPDLLEDGNVVVGECGTTYFCDRNPRTGIGITPEGQILLVTVDGRSKSSVGMTLDAFARLFQYLGATSAINLDGGGSTTMVVRDGIVNVPSGGYERPVGSALLVLPGPDPAESEPEPYVAPTATPTPPPPVPPPTDPSSTAAPLLPADPSEVAPTSSSSGDATWPRAGRELFSFGGSQGSVRPGCQALLDPASTGGMLDAIATGAIPSEKPLSRELRWALRVFRGRALCR